MLPCRELGSHYWVIGFAKPLATLQNTEVSRSTQNDNPFSYIAVYRAISATAAYSDKIKPSM